MKITVGDLVYNKAFKMLGVVVDIVEHTLHPAGVSPTYDFYEVLYEENKTDFSVRTDLEVINETY